MLIPMRVQSPSSIKTYQQCPRKYYYNYIAKLPTLPNIHQLRGNIVHSVLERFFQLDVGEVTKEDFRQVLHVKMQELLVECWKEKEGALEKLGLEDENIVMFFEESMHMLDNWLKQLFSKLEKSPLPFDAAWKTQLPLEQEEQYVSERYGVRGFIDVVEQVGTEIRVMDYKTDKRPDVEKHKLQLAIYALLYQEKHGTLPTKAGIYFLKGDEAHVEVDEALVEFAKREVELIHQSTQSKEKVDYPKQISPLCKWRTGQCDFYDTCLGED
ncbi:MAG: PD-(D/E)XK nuclease family protein [Candidatus Woesearchaeota archaeon]|jgi:RecB family exonuclease|nr:PD-(D/E)XK nuclease family protein [Candidatus Woesearchaeota archaeon]MDP7198984.1 PD-(D/E)XK nuclease family protein [Candidatus Woesearchaeota archaeon]MDP7467364.1 PD-(D/E)XK nuclease family protein [Candidatus Woesearchaeota archaeon]MDP7646582.1 PD-(D/E)XK nuclease family protein [Candidatus Woesearchaeota archaeon]|tara:strand:- start:65 stop:871 length:807 start_codon:yes stop_codon:yes gene_type:complete